jgi:hypothetical protein
MNDIRAGRSWVKFSPQKMRVRGVGLIEIAKTALTLRGLAS